MTEAFKVFRESFLNAKTTGDLRERLRSKFLLEGLSEGGKTKRAR